MIPRTMMTVEELAERWGLNPKTVYAAVEKGQLVALRVGRVLRISRSHVEALEQRGFHGGAAKD